MSATRGPVGHPSWLDHTDRSLIAALQANGREPFRPLAARLGVSEATVRNRYARLVDAGVLQVTAVTNPIAMGYDAIAMLGLNVDGPAEVVADELATWEEVIYAVIVAGRYDLLVEVVSRDRHELLLLLNRVKVLAGVNAAETFMYLDLAVQRNDFGTAVA
ncbi:MAG: Lrp/AsnC family transcriptional regulator, regulator for asnA, asnC and gidA [Solirubrobacteraceae bacterium]|nr:Lrp/AsnC family transcriptional regulator, regulator for asnA, asnC and gidA [Solirubrobacteraceae bacterium]